MGRRCNLCGDSKQDGEFSGDRHAPEGLQRRCRSCDKLVNHLRYLVRIGRISKEERKRRLQAFKGKKAITRMRAPQELF
jgi:hypothetical protein